MGRTYLFTGASSLIAQETIRAIATKEPDARIIAHYHKNRDGLEALGRTLRAELHLIEADLRDEQELNRCLDSVVETFKVIDAYSHWACPKFRYIHFKDLTWLDVEAEWQLQLRPAFVALKQLLPIMVKQKYGRVLLVNSSVTSGTPPKGLTHYTTIKYALLGLLKSIDSEYAGKNICINAIAPSMVDTPLLSEIPRKFIEIAAHHSSSGALVTPKEIAPIAQKLLAEDAGMSGHSLPILN